MFSGTYHTLAASSDPLVLSRSFDFRFYAAGLHGQTVEAILAKGSVVVVDHEQPSVGRQGSSFGAGYMSLMLMATGDRRAGWKARDFELAMWDWLSTNSKPSSRGRVVSVQRWRSRGRKLAPLPKVRGSRLRATWGAARAFCVGVDERGCVVHVVDVSQRQPRGPVGCNDRGDSKFGGPSIRCAPRLLLA